MYSSQATDLSCFQKSIWSQAPQPNECRHSTVLRNDFALLVSNRYKPYKKSSQQRPVVTAVVEKPLPSRVAFCFFSRHPLGTALRLPLPRHVLFQDGYKPRVHLRRDDDESGGVLWQGNLLPCRAGTERPLAEITGMASRYSLKRTRKIVT